MVTASQAAAAALPVKAADEAKRQREEAIRIQSDTAAVAKARRDRLA
jgi:hypothetical protein